jgi:hypothetical protein
MNQYPNFEKKALWLLYKTDILHVEIDNPGSSAKPCVPLFAFYGEFLAFYGELKYI